MVASMTQDEKRPIVDICVVADKARCPPGYEVISKAFDDPNTEADVWKDGFFAFSRILRYICISRTIPPNTFVCNVVADVAVTNAGDIVPSGFTIIETCADTREKALRKRQLCLRTMPRESAVDAVTDIVLLTKLKKPPTGYSLAGDIDGLLLCYKYGTIPDDFPGARRDGSSNVYPNLPYPIHPLSHSNTPSQPSTPGIGGNNESGGYQRQSAPPAVSAAYSTLDRQYSMGVKLGIEGVPFEFNHLFVGQNNQRRDFPRLKPATAERVESEFSYDFNIEQTILEN